MSNESRNPSDELEKRRELLDKEWDELLKRNLSNTESLAKYVFSLSSAGLGVSLVVVKDMKLLDSGNFKWILIVSWAAFLITISFALVSYLTSLHGIDKEFDRIEEEYEEEVEEEAEDKKKKPGRTTKILRYVIVISCIIGVICTPLFIVLNILNVEL
ncbi:MAG: hypothetical protein OXD49_14670 [Candidatus Poribacteria bacterium]|nr:hypothetical protein [Candidatus Poribacteria bacterium]